MLLLATSSIVGIIVAIALVATTIAVCLYLYSQKKTESPSEENGEDEASNS
ncbi:MAG: hypothetical protein K6E59_03380 [Bacilli bacterium]|nr:hypothetical protein [Bacilli bacterium]